MSPISTLFVLKENEEHCILFDPADPVSLYEALFEKAEAPNLGISRQDVLEVIEGIVPDRLRAI